MYILCVLFVWIILILYNFAYMQNAALILWIMLWLCVPACVCALSFLLLLFVFCWCSSFLFLGLYKQQQIVGPTRLLFTWYFYYSFAFYILMPFYLSFCEFINLICGYMYVYRHMYVLTDSPFLSLFLFISLSRSVCSAKNKKKRRPFFKYL